MVQRSELARLEWRDIDLNRAVLVVRVSKSKKPRDIPLGELAIEILRSRLRTTVLGSEPVLPFANERPDRLTESFNAAAKRAGLDEFRYHDLRHGFGSRLAQAGVPIPTIQRLMGHADVAQTMRYAGHLPENAERDAIALADRARKLAPKESNVSA